MILKKNKFKVGIDARMLGYSGVGRYVENLVKELLLIDKKNQYVLFVQEGQDISNYKNCKIVEVNAPIYSTKEQTNFLRAINKENLDLMHFTHFNRPILYNQPSIVTIHDLTPLYFPGKKRSSFIEQKAYRFVLKNALKKASKIIAVSNFTKNDLIKNFPFAKEKIQVIYEGVDSHFALISKQISKPYLLYVGIWREHKNLLGLIKAFEKLKISNLDLRFVIVGKPDPYYPEIPKAVESSKFKKDIILTGYVDDAKLAHLYQNATALVFPSFYEGFGLPGLEAMTLDCPVISSNATSLPEIYGEAAIYFDPHNINDMVDKILRLLNNEALRKELIEKGKKQVLKYSWTKTAKETLRLYNSLL
ncbi:MAG: glycosyltransferase family 1 protein [Candidatus Berkelbacteria bacterium]|nr:glycosyltransferase family 1 protein [Candidatus Berkelbacteria bacterium]